MTPTYTDRLIERAREIAAAIKEGRQPRGPYHEVSQPVAREFLPAYLNGAASVLLEQLADALEKQA